MNIQIAKGKLFGFIGLNYQIEYWLYFILFCLPSKQSGHKNKGCFFSKTWTENKFKRVFLPVFTKRTLSLLQKYTNHSTLAQSAMESMPISQTAVDNFDLISGCTLNMVLYQTPFSKQIKLHKVISSSKLFTVHHLALFPFYNLT